MSYLFDGVDDFLEATGAAISAQPFTFSIWVKPAALGADMTVMSQGDSTVTTKFQEVVIQANSTVRFRESDASSAQAATATGSVSLDTWVHAVGVSRSIADRSAYRDGGSRGNNAVSKAFASTDRIAIGKRAGGTATPQYFNGRLAEVAIWSTDLFDDEIASLALGRVPTSIRPARLAAYWPLLNNAEDVVGSFDLTPNGATVDANHPTIYGPGGTVLTPEFDPTGVLG